MSLRSRIEGFRDAGILSPAQADALVSLEDGNPLSLSGEIRAFFYAGALLVAAGAGLTVQKYMAEAGPAVIIGALSIGAMACFLRVFRRAPAWSREAVPSPSAGFDYVLFLGCLLLSLDIGYAEGRFHLLGDDWRRHFLAAWAIFSLLAYRFDNRLVLSLAVSSLAAWFGLEMSAYKLAFWEFHQEYALTFGGLCLVAGLATWRGRVKPHFLDVYLNFAVPFLGAGLLSGVEEHKLASLHFYLLAAACAGTAAYAFRDRKFAFLVWAALFGYAGITTVILPWFRYMEGITYLYFIFSSLAFAAGLFVAARRFKEDA